ncbi:hypothetical protein TVAG_536990 [Trichomonas vaginalis G3]|uniref:Uncharacterized protein n=1 Tax=Trichomonas vaginalis (strain ATCC PRA-98 / G3) TaxID=412133 RepID=A2I0Q7_TRIV3|nr:hypothetical protein TVAG_536990 [Trichomonas vaginalis G3]|eukprot:XP_001277690.1 hypothetical protein [Trichomonas vaginalis G3]
MYAMRTEYLGKYSNNISLAVGFGGSSGVSVVSVPYVGSVGVSASLDFNALALKDLNVRAPGFTKDFINALIVPGKLLLALSKFLMLPSCTSIALCKKSILFL